MQEDRLILVDLHDREIGQEMKMQAHQKGLLHRAFSVFLFDGDRLWIQKRAAGKYHSGGLWANTCCSHPRAGESLEQAVHRRLQQEVGADCPVQHLTSFVYRADFPQQGLSEYELDHIFIGQYAGVLTPNPEEIEELRAVPVEELAKDMRENPARYAPWFLTAFTMVYAAYHAERREAAQ